MVLPDDASIGHRAPESGERGLAGEPLGVVARRDEQYRGHVDADTAGVAQRRVRLAGEAVELAAELLEIGGEGFVLAG